MSTSVYFLSISEEGFLVPQFSTLRQICICQKLRFDVRFTGSWLSCGVERSASQHRYTGRFRRRDARSGHRSCGSNSLCRFRHSEWARAGMRPFPTERFPAARSRGGWPATPSILCGGRHQGSAPQRPGFLRLYSSMRSITYNNIF
jgi:hypothetical protein